MIEREKNNDITKYGTFTVSNEDCPTDYSPGESLPKRILAFLILVHNKYFVVIWIFLAIMTALAYPSAGIRGGPMKPEITANWVAVIIIFLISGLKIQTRDFLKAFQACKETIAVQFFVFGFFPVFGYLISNLMDFLHLDSKLAIGVMLLSCCPTTVSTANIMVQMAGANESLAIINTKLNNFIGIFMTPTLIFLYLHHSTKINFVTTIIGLLLTVTVPIVIGQLIRFLVPGVAPFTKKYKVLISRTSTMMIVYIVWATFSEAFHNGIKASWGDMFATELFLFLIFAVAHSVPFLFSLFFMNNTRATKVAMVICSGEKTVAMGVPLLTKMFENSPSLGLYTLPLIMYHSTQILTTGGMLPYIHDWILREPQISNEEYYELKKLDKNDREEECDLLPPENLEQKNKKYF